MPIDLWLSPELAGALALMHPQAEQSARKLLERFAANVSRLALKSTQSPIVPRRFSVPIGRTRLTCEVLPGHGQVKVSAMVLGAGEDLDASRSLH